MLEINQPLSIGKISRVWSGREINFLLLLASFSPLECFCFKMKGRNLSSKRMKRAMRYINSYSKLHKHSGAATHSESIVKRM